MKIDRAGDTGLLILRVVVGLVFFMHGGQKLFVQGLPGVAAFMLRLGVPLPPVAAVFITLLELVGGALLIVGLFARAVGLLIAIEMLVAMGLVHIRNGFFLHGNSNGVEFALTLSAASCVLVLLGAGRWSVDGWRTK